jgi:hypothetical protein
VWDPHFNFFFNLRAMHNVEKLQKNDTQYDDLTRFDTHFAYLLKLDTGDANSFNPRNSDLVLSSAPL